DSDVPPSDKALVSWKEIAAFLGRAERTVKRWECERGLPVHRVPGGERGGVFAYSSELNAWLLGRQAKEALQDTDSEEVELHKAEERTSPCVTEIKTPAQPTSSARAVRRNHWFVWVAVPTAFLAWVTSSLYVSAHHQPPSGDSALHGSLIRSHIPSPRAEQLYLQGRYEWSQRTEDGLAKSVDSYTRAIVEDSDYAAAYAGLAESYDLLPEYGPVNPQGAFRRALAAANKAIELDPNLAAGHLAKAFALFYGDWNATDSDLEFKRALALEPNSAETHHWYATSLFSRLEPAEAMAEIDRAVRLRPTSPSIVADAAFIHAFFHDNREANIRVLREVTHTQPKLMSPYRYLAEFDLEDGRYAEYLHDLRQAAAISHDPDEVALANDASAGWAHEKKTGMLEGIRRAQLESVAQNKGSGYWLARTYLLLGKPTDALYYFNQAFNSRDYLLMNLSACSCLANLRNDPSYKDLLLRVHQEMYPNQSIAFAYHAR
ncbi:MAG TPA: hypothetical protein VGS41_18345, partial [Chthonomonadales bacterium]|nr:hypothetical protein [Chthonomonadales bacterium]